jgi:hypothetical protein
MAMGKNSSNRIGHVRKILLFLKKKKQKDFYFSAAPEIQAPSLKRGAGILPLAPGIKVFWFFSSEKNIFPIPLAAAAV